MKTDLKIEEVLALSDAELFADIGRAAAKALDREGGPLTEEEVQKVVYGLDLAVGPDWSTEHLVMLSDNGTITGYLRRDVGPSGHITVNGEPMPYWLPPGVSTESIHREIPEALT